jgi:hypothetical protein
MAHYYMPKLSFTFHAKHSLHGMGGDALELLDLLLHELEHLHRRVVTMVSASVHLSVG